jgi:glycosyltransferase involved in cell wall biosynthesis
MKTCVIIPTYNEAEQIARIIREIKAQDLDVIVIDDGSTDNTSLIARNNGAIVLRNKINQGKGASLIKGFGYALKDNYEAVITMDGDGQHSPENIPYFLRLAKDSDSAVFIGNRMNKSKNMPWVRFLTNKFMSWLISCIIKQNIPDTQCGFRLLKRDLLQRINLLTSKYETESEIIIKSARLGFKIESISIPTLYMNEKSRINPFIDTLRFIRFIVRELLYGR